MLRNLEHAGDPWGTGSSARLEWAGRPAVRGARARGATARTASRTTSSTCSGSAAPARSTTRPSAPPGRWRSCCTRPGCRFMVLGEAETCTGDPARRMGNEFLFQMLAQQNVETLNAAGVRRIVATCAHCFNTLANEYPQLGGHYEVVHHTQLLARLVAEGRLTPGQPRRRDGHLPRRLLPRPAQPDLRAAARAARQRARRPARRDAAQPGAVVLLRRRRRAHVDGRDDRQRINENRADEALATAARPRRRGLPVLHRHAHRRRRPAPAAGHGSRESVEVTDVSEVLLRSVRPSPSLPTAPRRTHLGRDHAMTAPTADTTAGHAQHGGDGLDLATLNLMLEALGDFVAAELPESRMLELDHEDVLPRGHRAGHVRRRPRRPAGLHPRGVRRHGRRRLRLLPGLRAAWPASTSAWPPRSSPPSSAATRS